MRINFENSELDFVEMKAIQVDAPSGDKEEGVALIISSQDHSVKTKTSIVNSVELTMDEFRELISEINFDK